MSFLSLPLFVAVLGGFSFSRPAFADLSGQWSGDWKGIGHANDSATWKTDCASMQITLLVTANDFKVSGTHFVCGSLTSQQKHDEDLQIDRGNLLYNGQVIGAITDSEAHIKVSDSSGHLSWWDFKLNADGSLSYSDHQALLHQEAYLEFQGTFLK